MSNRMTLDTDQVLAIASQIESDNQQLQRLLEDSKTTLDSLSASWTGQASEQTRSAYNSFSTTYFQTYYDVLDQYVKFLRTNVSQQYQEAETVNTQLADAFM